MPQVKVGTFRLLRYAAQDWQYMAIGAVASGIIGLQVGRSPVHTSYLCAIR